MNEIIRIQKSAQIAKFVNENLHRRQKCVNEKKTDEKMRERKKKQTKKYMNEKINRRKNS